MNLTTSQIDALPVGSTIYDCHGHQLTRREHETRPWIYTRLLNHHAAEEIGTDHPRSYGPYRLQAGLTQEELDAVPVGFRIQDKDGDQLTRREGGYTYTNLMGAVDDDPDGHLLVQLKADRWPAPFTMAPLTDEELGALPVGSKIQDSDGEELTRVEDGWRYTLTMEDYPGPGMRTLPHNPHTLVSLGQAPAAASLTPEDLEALPVGAKILDRDGKEITRVSEKRWGYTHLQGEDVDFWGPKTGPTSGLTFGPYTLVSGNE